jgi:hypothetical protein
MFDDGEYGVEELYLRFDPPVRRSELPDLNVRQLADKAFVHRLEMSVSEDIAAEHGYPYTFDEDGWATVRAEARRAARGQRHYRVTDEFLERIVGWHRDGGVRRVIKETQPELGREPSERTVRRWLAEARERGLR